MPGSVKNMSHFDIVVEDSAKAMQELQVKFNWQIDETDGGVSKYYMIDTKSVIGRKDDKGGIWQLYKELNLTSATIVPFFWVEDIKDVWDTIKEEKVYGIKMHPRNHECGIYKGCGGILTGILP